MGVTVRLGYTELESGQAVPETTVNETTRRLEQGANTFIVKDKDLATPPGSPASSDAYIVAGSPTGAWVGWAKSIAFYMNGAWAFITPIEGTKAYVQDEDITYEYSGSAWAAYTISGLTESTDSEMWTGTSTTTRVTPRRIFTAAAPVTVASGTTITLDGNAGINFKTTLGHNATLANPSNMKVGQSGIYTITQDGTGSRTLAYGSDWKFPGGSPVLSTAAGSVDVLSYFVNAAGQILCNLTKAYS